MQKLLKDLVLFNLNELNDGDLAMAIDDFDLFDMAINDAWEIAKKQGLVQGDSIILPKGTPIINRELFGGAEEFTFNFNGKTIRVDLAFDNEDEYIG